MKKIVWGVISLLVAISACTPQQPNGYSVTGEIKDSLLNGTTIYIWSYNDAINIDSTTIENGKFEFTGVIDTAELCRIVTAQREFVTIVLENKPITVNFSTYSASGTASNDKLVEIQNTIDSIMRVYDLRQIEELASELSNDELMSARDSLLQALSSVRQEYIASVLSQHNNDPIGHAVIYMIDKKVDKDKLVSLISTLGPWLKSRKVVKDIVDTYHAEKRTAEGQPYTDVEGVDVEGKKVTLSNYLNKGNYVLVDFWASWCGPCKAENPNLRKLYEQYNDKGLTIVGVCVWDEEENFKKSIQEENILWPQLFDTSDATTTYGIQGIPHIMLIAPDGTIVKRGLRGATMMKLIEETFNKK